MVDLIYLVFMVKADQSQKQKLLFSERRERYKGRERWREIKRDRDRETDGDKIREGAEHEFYGYSVEAKLMDIFTAEIDRFLISKGVGGFGAKAGEWN